MRAVLAARVEQAPQIELVGKHVLVVGLARTGIATALFCAARGARVTASDARSESEIGEAVAPFAPGRLRA